MSFLNDLGLENVDADPNAVPDGEYRAFVTEAKVDSFKDAAKGNALILTYKLTAQGADESDTTYKGREIREYKSCNGYDDNSKKAWLKQRLLSLGVPESRFGSLNPSDLVGIEVYVTVRNKNGYRNAQSVRLASEAGTSAVSSSPAVGDVSSLI